MNRFLEGMARGGELRPPRHVLVPLAEFREDQLSVKSLTFKTPFKRPLNVIVMESEYNYV